MHHGGFEARKAELETRAIEHGTWKSEGAGSASGGEAGELGTAGIRQAQEFGGLVEGLTGRVVPGLAEKAIAANLADLNEHRVPAGDQQRHMGKGWRLGLE